MNPIDDAAFQDALREAEAGAARRPRPVPPTRFLVRALFVPLGEALLESASGTDAVLARLRRLVEGDREAWEAAVRDELTLAATEHVRSCDPRYLKIPSYDFPYTVAARHRLEARLRAASEIGFTVDETLLDQVTRADGLLQPYLERANGA